MFCFELGPGRASLKARVSPCQSQTGLGMPLEWLGLSGWS